MWAGVNVETDSIDNQTESHPSKNAGCFSGLY